MNNESILVSEGIIKDSRNKIIISRGFAYCSAVVADYDEGALFAHTLPRPIELSKSGVNVYNVVDKLVEIIQNKQIPLKNVKAYINAGKQCDLDRISDKFVQQGIEVIVGNTYLAPDPGKLITWPTRDVVYNPLTKELKILPIQPHSSFKLY